MKARKTRDRGDGPPDRDQRDLILTVLDRSMIVEAAAGTGKTASMVGRMIALLGTGTCRAVRSMAAVTFTRKAAAELRARFQAGLEQAAGRAEGEARGNLRQALESIEQCFIGTIHAFCARLLRERPIEGKVDLSFTELDELDDARLRAEAWDAFAASAIAGGGGTAAELDRLGLRLADLEETFMRFADYPDVDEWPVPAGGEALPRVEEAAGKLRAYLARMRRLAPRLPEDPGHDTLIPEIRRIPRVASHFPDLDEPVRLMEILELFDRKRRIVQRVWAADGAFTGQDARKELDRWNDFRDEVARPLLLLWRERRYGPVLRLMREAQGVYDRMRRDLHVLSYQDLLVKAAALLRDHPHVRLYFRERITHLLVDEFQDTDPVQAEVLLLLAADDPGERRWQACRPRPGSLFVVGDPKQSIYRFRRADIVTYNEVKRIVTGGGAGSPGLEVRLSANFRSAPALVELVNRVFEPDGAAADDPSGPMLRFPAEASAESPAYVPLAPGRQPGAGGKLEGIFTLTAPEGLRRAEDVAAWEADRIARLVRHALDGHLTVPRTKEEIERGATTRAAPSDFLILARNKERLGIYARALQRCAIPHQVTGSASLCEVAELRLLHRCLMAALHPDSPIELVGALRSELFGISDASLYAFRKAGGAFSFHAPVPAGLGAEDARAFGDAFERLRRYALLFSRIPPLAAVEAIARDLGLPALGAARGGGDVEAGSFLKALEVLRSARSETWTAVQIAAHLGDIVEMEEKHDGMSALAQEAPAVRVMNLHKAKGLEAPVVFLADPSGESSHDVEIHVDRSGEKTVGAMAVFGKRAGHRRPLLALPPAWEERAAAEGLFQRAESLRLRYVAVTRAGAALVVTRGPGKDAYSPWRPLLPFLDGAKELPDPEVSPQRRETPVPIEAGEAALALREIRRRLETARTPSCAVFAAKAYALSSAPVTAGALAAAVEGEGEHGVEWGLVVHQLLHLAASRPGADLLHHARTALAEQELDVGLAGAAVDLVRGVTASTLWRRALGSRRRLTEVPFEIVMKEGGGRPVLLRGAIDLVFEEPDGWVLVDYKTDSPGRRPGAVAARYAPQLRLYADAWRTCTGQKVKEALIFFVNGSLTIDVPLSV